MTRTDEASLKIAASPVRVFKALLKADAVERWLPPDGTPAQVEQLEPKAGGALRVARTPEDGMDAGGTPPATVIDARFVEIQPGVQVVMDVAVAPDDPSNDDTMRTTWEVSASGSGALVVFRSEGVPEGAPDHAEDFTRSLQNLAALVT